VMVWDFLVCARHRPQRMNSFAFRRIEQKPRDPETNPARNHHHPLYWYQAIHTVGRRRVSLDHTFPFLLSPKPTTYSLFCFPYQNQPPVTTIYQNMPSDSPSKLISSPKSVSQSEIRDDMKLKCDAAKAVAHLEFRMHGREHSSAPNDVYATLLQCQSQDYDSSFSSL